MNNMMDSMPVWELAKADICDAITATPADFKIVLKIKDDVFFFERWVEHHAKIVGIQNLIIFDNNSQDSQLLEIYSKYNDKLLIVRFGGFYNDLHRPAKYPELYKSLINSCKYYQFLDCDEFLVYIDQNFRIIEPNLITKRVIETNAGLLPASWLENVQGEDQKFWWDLSQNHPILNLRTGKPIIRNDKRLEELMCHNWQVGLHNCDENVSTNFFVLHLKRLSLNQRIEANMRKLNAYNAFKGPFSMDDVINVDADKFPVGNSKNWIREIQKLIKLSNIEAGGGRRHLSNGMIEFIEGRAVSFSSEDQRDLFYQFLSRPTKSIENAIRASDRI